MVFSFKEKFKTQTSKSSKSQNKCVCLCLNLPLRSVSRISFLSTGMELYQDIFIKCLSLHAADTAQDH